MMGGQVRTLPHDSAAKQRVEALFCHVFGRGGRARKSAGGRILSQYPAMKLKPQGATAQDS